jgi:hypothetical protein
MATEQGSSSGNGFLYFAIGALIVGVGVLAWMFYNGQTNRSSSDTAIEHAADSIGDAAEKIGDSAKDATRNIPAPAPAPQPAPPATPPG